MFSEHFYRYRPLLNQQIFLQNHLHGFDIRVNANAGKERQHLQIMLKSEELALILCVCVHFRNKAKLMLTVPLDDLRNIKKMYDYL